MVLLPKGLHALQQGATEVGVDLRGAYVDRNGGCEAKAHRQSIVNAGMLPTMQEPLRNRKCPKRGCNQLFNAAIHACRLNVSSSGTMG
jgi:hypothetical protein